MVARRLHDAGHSVTVVEAGGADSGPSAVSVFDAVGAPGAVFPGPYLRGRGIGGSSAVNGMVASIGDLEQYRAWGWDDVTSALSRVSVPRADAVPGPVDAALLAAAPDAAAASLTWRDGVRVSAATVYLAGTPVEVIAGVSVSRVVLDGSHVTGVVVGDDRVVPADAVAVCAGAVGSPLLLWASGVAHPELGRGLRNHPGLPVTLQLRPGLVADVHGLVTGAVLRRDDIEIVAMNHLGPHVAGHAMLLVVALAPTGVGRVWADGSVDHVVSAADASRLAAGLDIVRELLAHPAFDAVVSSFTVGDAPAGVYHATSTCRMGAVVDDDGRVEGFSNLFVVDASVFPDIPHSGTYLPTLVLAEHLAARLTSLT